jgi:bifunctional N-acetylglucosamine-1-phosphate-uridyltransferase/glucosamine-1-phosphate-acetyltransferase GlmU-like protein
VLPGDHPFIGVDFLRRFAEAHLAGGTAVTLATASVGDFPEQDAFLDYDRVARDSFGQVSRLLSPSLTRGSEAVWPEVSPGYFCFQASWLWPNLYRLGDANPEHESRLADLVNIALAERKEVREVRVVPVEALGADTPEQLKSLENRQSQF